VKYTQRHSKHLQLVQPKNIAMASVEQTFVAQSNVKYKQLVLKQQHSARLLHVAGSSKATEITGWEEPVQVS